MAKLRPLLLFGTRPEAIKMAPIVHACRCREDSIKPIVALTGQHREMLNQIVTYFGIQADVNLDIMQPGQTLAALTARCLEGINDLLLEFRPDCVVVQGDTTTVMAASLASFYQRIPLVHVEAGLRTGNLDAPWPEELNRRITGLVTRLHCAPTKRAADALLAEGVASASVFVTGNTVIDALFMTLSRERANHDQWKRKYASLGDRRMVLVTGHRRENFGQGMENICRALGELARRFPDCEFVYPVHLNPQVQEPVHRLLKELPNVHLLSPRPYAEFVWLMDRSELILTDSGGVQEEAPSIGKPVLVMRDTTERPEAVEAGAARLVGASVEKIVKFSTDLLENPGRATEYRVDSNPYGDGNAASRIVDLMLAKIARRAKPADGFSSPRRRLPSLS